MKNLFFLMMAILLINVSFAAEVGENQKADCVTQVQSSRVDGKDVDVKKEVKEDSSATSTSVKQ